MTSAGRGKAHLPHESTRGLPCPPWIATLRPAGVRVKVEIACLRLRVRRGWPRSLAPRRPPAHGRAWFYDGYGIPGETGDEIQLEGQREVARVTAVDLAANRLQLDRALTWTAGQGVALRYGGSRPDVGAFESGLQ